MVLFPLLHEKSYLIAAKDQGLRTNGVAELVSTFASLFDSLKILIFLSSFSHQSVIELKQAGAELGQAQP